MSSSARNNVKEVDNLESTPNPQFSKLLQKAEARKEALRQKKAAKKGKSTGTPFYGTTPSGSKFFSIDEALNDPTFEKTLESWLDEQEFASRARKAAAGGSVWDPAMPEMVRQQLEELAASSSIIVPGFSNVPGHEEEYQREQESYKRRMEASGKTRKEVMEEQEVERIQRHLEVVKARDEREKENGKQE